MVLGTKSYYETIVQRARIQFFDDEILISEWVVNNGGEPKLSVPTTPGITVSRTEWMGALENIRKWVVGIELADILLSINKEPNPFNIEIKKEGNETTFAYSIDNIEDEEYEIRKITYDATTDELEIGLRDEVATIYWVDYLHYLKMQNWFKELITTIHEYQE